MVFFTSMLAPIFVKKKFWKKSLFTHFLKKNMEAQHTLYIVHYWHGADIDEGNRSKHAQHTKEKNVEEK